MRFLVAAAHRLTAGLVAITGYEFDLLSALEFLAMIVVGAVQLLYMFRLTVLIQARNSLTLDFALFEHARYLIAHGVINPIATVNLPFGASYLDNHFELIMWPIAWLSSVLPVPGWFVLRILFQVLPITGAYVITIAWARKLLADRISRPWVREAIVAAVASAIVLNPWIYITVAFDFHFQALQGFLLLSAAYALYRARYGWAWVSVLLLAATGETGASMVIGLALFGLLVRIPRRHFVAVLGVAVITMLSAFALHATEGSNLTRIYTEVIPANAPTRVGILQFLGYLLRQPMTAVRYVVSQRSMLFSNVQVYGAWALISPATVLLAIPFLENALAVPVFARPGFQWAPFYLPAAIGSAMLVAFVLRRVRFGIVKWGLVLVILLSGVGYSAHAWLADHAIWYEQFVAPMSSATGRAVGDLNRRTGGFVTVLADNAVIGAFADRRVGPEMITPAVRPESNQLLLVATPNQGVEVVPAMEQASYFAQAEHFLGARIAMARDGVYAVSWPLRQSQANVTFQPAVSAPSVLLATNIGVPHVSGRLSQWWLSSSHAAGVVLYTGQVDLSPGVMKVSVTYRSDRPLTLKVRSATRNFGTATMPASQGWRSFRYVDRSSATWAGGSLGVAISEPAGANVGLRGAFTFTSVPVKQG